MLVNRKQRMEVILRRDGAECVWCRRSFEGMVTPTTEHLVPRIKGGPSWIENEVAACARCNKERGHRTIGEWVEECRRRGLEPDQELATRTLRSLADAIAGRGGQRRARRYIVSQLRRLEA